MKVLSLLDKVKLSIILLFLLGVVVFSLFLDRTQCPCKTLASETERTNSLRDGTERSGGEQEPFALFEVEAHDEPEFAPYHSRKTYGSDYQEGFQEGLGLKDAENAVNALRDAWNKVMDFFNYVSIFFNEMERRIKVLVTRTPVDFAFAWIWTFADLAMGMGLGIYDIIQVLQNASKCGIKYMTNFRECIFWWMTEGVYSIFRSIVLGSLSILQGVTGIDLAPLFSDLWESIMVPLDDLFFDLSGFHFLHYPKWVLDDCYACDVMNSVHRLTADFQTTIPQIMSDPKHRFEKVGRDIAQLFDPIDVHNPNKIQRDDEDDSDNQFASMNLSDYTERRIQDR